jgi:myosin heavy subunit
MNQQQYDSLSLNSIERVQITEILPLGVTVRGDRWNRNQKSAFIYNGQIRGEEIRIGKYIFAKVIKISQNFVMSAALVDQNNGADLDKDHKKSMPLPEYMEYVFQLEHRNRELKRQLGQTNILPMIEKRKELEQQNKQIKKDNFQLKEQNRILNEKHKTLLVAAKADADKKAEDMEDLLKKLENKSKKNQVLMNEIEQVKKDNFQLKEQNRILNEKHKTLLVAAKADADKKAEDMEDLLKKLENESKKNELLMKEIADFATHVTNGGNATPLTSKMYSCKECNFDTNNKKSLAEHISSEHHKNDLLLSSSTEDIITESGKRCRLNEEFEGESKKKKPKISSSSSSSSSSPSSISSLPSFASTNSLQPRSLCQIQDNRGSGKNNLASSTVGRRWSTRKKSRPNRGTFFHHDDGTIKFNQKMRNW